MGRRAPTCHLPTGYQVVALVEIRVLPEGAENFTHAILLVFMSLHRILTCKIHLGITWGDWIREHKVYNTECMI